MTKQTKIIGAMATVAVLYTGSLAMADTLDDNKVVVDKNNQVILSDKHKTCVRTKWEGGENVCAPKVEQKTVEKTYRTLEKAEKTVYFNFNSAALTPEAQARLDTISTALKGASDVRNADIVGYADRIGSDSYNVKLSERRAKAVQDYMAARGYLNTRLAEIRGLGETDSITNCDGITDRSALIACLSADRRVEVEINYTDTKRVTTTE